MLYYLMKNDRKVRITMNKKDILEIKRRFKKEACTFTRMCGCYVDADRNKITKIGETFLNLEGALSALFTGNMSGSYASFTKPSFAPPGILFPIIWTILYLLMGVSSYIVAQSDHPDKLLALRTYFIQLFFNFMWSILFFGLSNYLQIPYLFWCIFAAILNFAVYLLN